MTRKIFANAFFLGASVLLVCAALFFALQYTQSLEETYDALKGEAVYAASGLALGGQAYLEDLQNINRVTWIAADGGVIYDSEYPELNANQRDCAEVASALAGGEGQGIRRSESGGVSTMYYAFRCADGTVLRLSRPLSAVSYALAAVSPVLWVFLLVLAVSALVAFRVAREILKPVNELDLDEPDPEKTYPELAPLVRRVKEQKETILREASDRERLRREFSANVSHELKTPLTSIAGFAELMKDGLVSDDMAREFSGDIYRESQRLIALIDDIMRLSKLDEANGISERESVDLYDTAEEVIRSLRPQAEARGIEMTLGGTHAVAAGERQIIREMLYNLADNAIKYNRDGGKVSVTVFYADGRPAFSVTDTGPGIAPAEQERVFERFYRVDKSHSKSPGGTGLGLSIVKNGALYHGASVTLQSELGEGTSVSVIF